MKVNLILTNVVGNQPRAISAKNVFMDFSRDDLELIGISEEDGREVFKKTWLKDRSKLFVRKDSKCHLPNVIDLILPLSILEFYKSSEG